MHWSTLLSRRRLGVPDAPEGSIARTEFQRDFDRIVFSSSFRRLQDKTQVFPLARNDYVRTRLTHSLEVSSVGRSLGTLVGQVILDRHSLPGYAPSDVGDLCAAACLAHDLGNPPFGHSGEDAIRHWVGNTASGRDRILGFSQAQREDFLRFEGNAQGFRLLSRLQHRDNPGGLQLTCATLGAFSKYPQGSEVPAEAGWKKFGFFSADQASFTQVAETLGLERRSGTAPSWCRHPLAFLVEAADDLCYRIIDIEDGFRLGKLSETTVRELFLPLVPEQARNAWKRFGNPMDRISFLRAKAIHQGILQVRDCFLSEEENLLAGRLSGPLIERIPLREPLAQLIEVAQENIYCAPEVVEIETAGFEVLCTLLDRLVPVLDELAEAGEASSPRSRIMALLIPEQFIGPGRKPLADPYLRLLSLTDFLSGMTDSYAVALYKKITGISLPGG